MARAQLLFLYLFQIYGWFSIFLKLQTSPEFYDKGAIFEEKLERVAAPWPLLPHA